MIVEMAGLPLAGKSTVRAELADALARRGIEVAGLTDARRSRMSLLRHARLVVAVVGVLVRSTRPVGERVHALKLVLVTVMAHASARSEPERVWLFDEGVVQRTFLLFVERDGVARRERVWALARLLPRPDVVVDVPVDIDDVRARGAARDRGLPPRLAGLGEEELRERLTGGRLVLDAALDATGALVVRGGASAAADAIVAARRP